ncbi:hypothetical protein TNCV_3650971 [Trichonephila clavipes]|uniref:Uncharacterized protein n=1 Tax=Trichonephila clavipes TaxID=2585209 RepID=A0A8X6SAC9_TRICX|nr:hypothetical protein TNCV_3650971 [Trichonephila clavipes]
MTNASGHQNTARRTGNRLKRRNCATSASSFVVRFMNRCFSLCCIVKGSRNNSYPEDSSRCCKRRHTVRADTGCTANMPILCLMVRDVVTRFCRADLSICLSSLMLVMAGDGLYKSFSMILSNLWFPYSNDSDWISTSAKGHSHTLQTHTLKRHRSCLYRISTLVDKHLFLFEA